MTTKPLPFTDLSDYAEWYAEYGHLTLWLAGETVDTHATLCDTCHNETHKG